MPNSSNSMEIMNSILSDFEKDNNIKVVVELLDWGVAFNRITNAFESKQLPDVLQLGTTWVAHFANMGYLTDLTQYYDDINYDRFDKTILETCRIFSNPNLYSVPWFVDLRAFFYNKEYMDYFKIDVDSVNSYDGFKRYLRKIKNSNYNIEGKTIYPFGFPGKNDWNVIYNFAPWIWSEGGDFIVYENEKWKSFLLNKKTINGICKYLNLYEEGLSSPESLKENNALVAQRFCYGDYASVYSVVDIIKTIEDEYRIGGNERSPLYNGGYHITGSPYGTTGSYTFFGGSNLVIPYEKRDNKDAYKLLKYLSSSEKIDAYCDKIKFLPPDMNLWEKWTDKEHYNKIVELIKYGKTNPNIHLWGKIESKLVNCLGDILELRGSSYYSYEKLYDILLKYNNEINDILNYKENNILTKPEFATYVANYQKSIFNKDNGAFYSFLILIPLIIFIILIFIILIILIKRRLLRKINFFNKSIFSSFILFVIITQIIVILLLGFIIIENFNKAEQQKTFVKNSNVANSISMYINSELDSYIQKLNILSNISAFTELKQNEIKKILSSQFYSQLFIPGEKVFVIDSKNCVIADNSVTAPYDYERSVKDISISMISPSDAYMSDVDTSGIVPKINIAVSLTMHSKGAIIGEFSLNRVTDFIKKQQIADKSFILIVDSNGNIVDRYGQKSIEKYQTLTDFGFKNGNHNQIIKDQINEIRLNDRKEYVVSYNYSKKEKLGVFIFERKNNLFTIIKANVSLLILMLFLIIIEALLISSYIYIVIVKPVNNLSNIFTDTKSNKFLESSNDLSYLRQNNEIGILYSGYNLLINNIDQKNNELIKLNDNLSELVIERTGELEEANVKLKHLDKLKNDFITNITHDFRSPITGIVGFCEFVLKHETDNKSIENYQHIYKSAKKLEYATERLLDLAKLDTKGFLFKIKKTDIKALIKQIIDGFSTQIAGTNIKLVFIPTDVEIDDFYTDIDKLEQILSNLLSNAIKYVDKNSGVIAVELTEQTDQIIIKVIDNGIGIESNDIDKIFTRFGQVDNEKNKTIKGSGIGLSFVKQLTEYLRGKVYVESKGTGYGSTFILLLPRGKSKYLNYDIIE